MRYSMKVIIPIITLIIIEIILISNISSYFSTKNLNEQTVVQAINIAKQYKELRTYYNHNVISKVLKYSDLKVDSNHYKDQKTIPLPATMIHDLSSVLTQKLDGMKLKLYSDYPFPNRSDRKLDPFELSAIQYFRKTNSSEPKVEHEIQNDKEVVRVAIADVMDKPSCVTCHNTRLDTPKNDWHLGDIRGVLEISIPIDSFIQSTQRTTHYIDLSIIIAGIILILFIHTVISYFESSDRKKTNDLNIKQDKLNKLLVNFSKNVIASKTDAKGFITYVSDAFCKISGYSEDELLGKSHSIIRHPDMKQELFEDIWDTIKDGKTWDGEIKNKNKNGTSYWVKTTIFPEYDLDDKLIGYSSIRHDISAQKEKDVFFSNMSHELRTPLNGIIGFTNILSKESMDDKHKEYIKLIDTNSHQLLDLINDILDLSKINNGQFTINPYDVNLYISLEEFIHRFDAIITKKNISFTTDIDKSLDQQFTADWLRISQIIINLLSNAIKFTQNEGEISLNMKYFNNNLEIVIMDNGIGMNKSIQDKIFKPFIQADGSTTRKYGGTGLGLSITQKLIELMNGSLFLQSEEGIGSTFTITIPLNTNKNSTEIQQHDEIEQTKKPLKGNILLVEDNKTNQLLMSLILEEFGLDCEIANDGLEAVNIYDPKKHNIILMDENMPNMNGIVAMKRIRKLHKDSCTPIIALTANAMEGDREKFLEAGMDDFLSKPINENELYMMLDKFLNT